MGFIAPPVVAARVPSGARLFVSASRVPSWVGPGAPHPEVLDALARATGAAALAADDFVVAHAGSFAAVLILTRGESLPRADLVATVAGAWEAANREGAKRGLAPVAGPRFEGELALPSRPQPDRIALLLAFNADAETVAPASRRAAGESAAGRAGSDFVHLHRLGDDPEAIGRLLASWRATGLPPARIEEAAHPANHARLVGLGFEVAERILLGPLDLLEHGWPPALPTV